MEMLIKTGSRVSFAILAIYITCVSKVIRNSVRISDLARAAFTWLSRMSMISTQFTYSILSDYMPGRNHQRPTGQPSLLPVTCCYSLLRGVTWSSPGYCTEGPQVAALSLRWTDLAKVWRPQRLRGVHRAPPGGSPSLSARIRKEKGGLRGNKKVGGGCAPCRSRGPQAMPCI
jgi:hypothetical protein